ncbi:MAG: hypothetical protein GC137_01755 [Alphaproteobacteria bacterium]|nr:hypothetical protein [Alphaproteobacteria bacterium]
MGYDCDLPTELDLFNEWVVINIEDDGTPVAISPAHGRLNFPKTKKGKPKNANLYKQFNRLTAGPPNVWRDAVHIIEILKKLGYENVRLLSKDDLPNIADFYAKDRTRISSNFASSARSSVNPLGLPYDRDYQKRLYWLSSEQAVDIQHCVLNTRHVKKDREEAEEGEDYSIRSLSWSQRLVRSHKREPQEHYPAVVGSVDGYLMGKLINFSMAYVRPVCAIPELRAFTVS